MPRPSDKTLFLRELSDLGGRATNGQLRERLGWSETKYWRVHQELFDEGSVEKGRGRGGTVLLVAIDAEGTSSEDVAAVEQAGAASAEPIIVVDQTPMPSEIDLYEPVLRQLERHWTRQRQLDECHCEITAFQGRRETGGSWSRPDICVIGSRNFEHYPSRSFEMHTFEVKPANGVTIKGVLEALAHRESATRSYVLYHTAGRDFGSYPESARIEELAGRHGVGVIAANIVDDFESWEEVVTAQRALSDPEAINTLVGRSLSDRAKRKIRQWFSW